MADFKNKDYVLEDENYIFRELDKTLTFQKNVAVITQGMVPYVLRKDIEKIIIPDGVLQIGTYAFSGFENLKSVTIPNSVNRIRSKAFSKCRNLKEIIMGNGVEVIENSAFISCSSIEKVYIKDLINWCNIKFESILANPLANVAKLYLNNVCISNLTFPDSIKSVKDYTFAGCCGINSLIIPKNVEAIDFGAFYNCKNLQKVKIGNDTKIIKDAAFCNCPSLAFIYLPPSITNIDGNALQTCSENLVVKYKETEYLKQRATENNIKFSSSKIDQFINLINDHKDLCF